MKEKLKLIGALDTVENILGKARVIVAELTEGYFEYFNPDDPEDRISIADYFGKYAVFASVLEMLLDDLEAECPRSDWAETLTITDVVAPHRKGA